MPCKKCGSERIGVEIVDAITIMVHCASCGPSYLFRKPGGGWEDSEERMARMRREHICEACEAPFHDYKDKDKTIRHLCNKCSVYIPEEGEIRRSMARNNERSPWRLRRVFQAKA